MEVTSEQFFETKYRQATDPWAFATSDYEQGRYAAIVAALGASRFRRGFEPGCSIGILTAQLAHFCDEVVAMDIAPTAVASARQYCRDLQNVTVRCGSLPGEMPAGSFDLIVFSEIGYYFKEEELLALADTLVGRLRSAGTLLAAHWLGESPDHLLSGDRVHELLGQTAGLRHQMSARHTGFQLDKWTRP